MNNRVVVTGLGIVSPIGNTISSFKNSLLKSMSNFQKLQELEDMHLGCHYVALPNISEASAQAFQDRYSLVKLRSSAVLYGSMAALAAWKDAGLQIRSKKEDIPMWDAGCIFGTSCAGLEAFSYNYSLAKEGNGRKMGGRIAQQAMNSGVSAYIGGIIGLGNQVTTNSSEGNTGLESIINGYYRIKWGLAKKMLVGATESKSNILIGSYDSIKLDNGSFSTLQTDNLNPKDIRMHSTEEGADGFIIGAGSGSLVIEDLDSALKRNAKIYAEIISVEATSGGQRNGGSFFSLNPLKIEFTIDNCVKKSNLSFDDIDLVSGCFFSNYVDQTELQILSELFQNKQKPTYLNATKRLIGNCLSGGGTIETIASIIEMNNSFVHGGGPQSMSPEISNKIFKQPIKSIKNVEINTVLKVSHGFGDISSAIILKKFN